VTQAATGRGSPVTIAFGGDVHFDGVLLQKLNSAPTTMIDAAKPLYAGADIMMVNLETAITTRGSAEPKQFNFRAPPTAFTALRAAGITVATEANNHGEDYGAQGLADSLAAAKAAGFPVIGIGNNVAEAFAPFRATINGQRIAIIAATQVLDSNLASKWTATDTHPGLASAYDETHLLAAVTDARATADTVVVYLHWGTEKQSCPNPSQSPLAHKLVSAGADIIVGSHTHVQLGAGHIGDAFVDYGLGNFVFNAQPGQTDSGVLAVTVRSRHIDSVTWRPARISGGVPIPLSGTEAMAANKQWQSLRACTDLTA
jgi:poly-gamma-glutamate synthesis protein (capsule biosynthesis protein)